MGTRTLVTPVMALVVAVLGTRLAAAQYSPMPNGPEALQSSATGSPRVGASANPCSPSCAPVPRIKVIVPPPEVVFRSIPAHGACPKEGAECAPARSEGQIAFNMNLNMAASANALASNGLLALLAGANSGGLGNSGLEALLMRALAARTAATPTNGSAGAPSPEAELVTRMRALTTGIETLSKRIDRELLPTLQAMKQLGDELDQLKKRLDKLDTQRGKNPSH